MKMKRRFLKWYLWLLQKHIQSVADRWPGSLVSLLRSNHLDLLAKGISDRKYHSWNLDSLPMRPRRFEDLSFLFWSTPINRGVARLDLDEAATIFGTVGSMSNPRGVEIGRFAGGSTLILATAVGAGGSLASIDIAPHDDGTLLEVLRRTDMATRVTLHVADANEVDLADELDFVFIDGDHSYEGAKKDHLKWGERVKVGGYILHHDMGNSRPHSIQWASLETLLRDILLNQGDELELVSSAGSLIVLERTAKSWTRF